MPTGFDLIGSNKALQEHWIKRIVAIIIDAIIVMVPLWVILLLIVRLPFLSLIGSLLMGLIWILYFVLLESSSGRTIGKKIMGLRVETVDGRPLDAGTLFVRNISKIFWLFLLVDWLIGFFTEGDPRQKFLDRHTKVVVARADEHAYMEEQFKRMQYIPPHPHVPSTPPATSAQPPAQQWPQAQPPAAPQQAPPPQKEWPHQEQYPQRESWPQHTPGAPPPMKFCPSCGGPLTQRGDGKMVCSRCGTVY